MAHKQWNEVRYKLVHHDKSLWRMKTSDRVRLRINWWFVLARSLIVGLRIVLEVENIQMGESGRCSRTGRCKVRFCSGQLGTLIQSFGDDSNL